MDRSDRDRSRRTHDGIQISFGASLRLVLCLLILSPSAFGAWSGASLLETQSVPASTPQSVYDNSGNGIAVWAQGSEVWMRRYDAATSTWTGAQSLSTASGAVTLVKLAIDATSGSAVVAWIQHDGVADSVYASRYNAATGSWSGAQGLETSAVAVPTYDSLAVAARGAHGAVAWIQADAAGYQDIYVSRYDGSVWSAPNRRDEGSDFAATQPSIAIDASDNVQVVWRQGDVGGGSRAYSSRWEQASQTWSVAETVDVAGGVRQPRIVALINGRMVVAWRDGPEMYARRYDGVASSWLEAPTQINSSSANTVYSSDLAADSSGNALVVWVQSDGVAPSIYARRFDAISDSWGAVSLLEGFATTAAENWEPSAAINGSTAAVTWVQSEGPEYGNLYVARMSNGAWSAPYLLESRDEKTEWPHIAIDAAGNTTAVWIQGDGTARSVYQNTLTIDASDSEAPTIPSGVSATTASSTQINLSWTASTDNVGVTSYLIERCQGAGCATFSQIATVTGMTFNDTALTASSSYSYRIRAVDAATNVSGYSSIASAATSGTPDTQAPTAPSGVSAATASSTQIDLSWTASTDNVGVTNYLIERCTEAACANFIQIAASAGTTYSDIGLTASTTYRYRIRATDAASNLSGYSTIASATTAAEIDTTPPSTPTVTATSVSSTQINLSWTASTDNVGVTNYLIERCIGAGCTNFTQIATSTSTGYSNAGLTASTNYRYRVRATDAANNLSGYSNTASATTLAPITYSYTYDALGRITQAAGSDGSVINYQYDANGNVTTINRQ